MEERKTVKIPRQIRLKTEFFVGFGMEELIKTIIVGVIMAILSFIFYKITGQTLIATMIVIGAMAISVIALIKGNNNFSMLDIIKNIVRFEFMQKEYKYKRGDLNNKFIKKAEESIIK